MDCSTPVPCPSPTPRVYPNPCPLCRWCHPTISSSVVSFSSRLQSFPASGSFPMSQFFASRGQSIGVSASVSVLPMNLEGLFPRMDLLDLLAVQGTLKSLLQHHSSKASMLQCSAFFMSNSHIHTWLLEKPYLWLDRPLLVKWCLLLNMLSRLVIDFLPRSKRLLISCLQSQSAVILEPKNVKSVTVSISLPWSDGTRCHDLSFLNLEL